MCLRFLLCFAIGAASALEVGQQHHALARIDSRRHIASAVVGNEHTSLAIGSSYQDLWRKVQIAVDQYASKPCSNALRTAPAILVGFVVMLFCAVAGWLWTPDHRQPEDVARNVMLLAQFICALNFTLVIVDAYQLSIAIGRDAAFSGVMIGSYMIGLPLGAVVIWSSLRIWPFMWQSHGRMAFMVALSFNALGALLYAMVEFTALNAGLIAWTKVFCQVGACVARVLAGCGGGMVAQTSQVLFVKLTVVLDRPKQMLRFLFTTMLGVGVGPLITVGLHKFDFCEDNEAQFKAMGPLQFVTALATLVSVIFFFPSLKGVQDQTVLELSFSDNPQEDDSGPHEMEEAEKLRRRIVVSGCLAMTVLRGFILSGLEAATSLLLEVKYKWSSDSIGLLISCTFLGCIPLKLLIDQGKGCLALTSWFRLLVAFSAVGCVFLFPQVCNFLQHGNCGMMLLLADTLLFPCLYMGDALQRGVMQQNLMPEGSVLDANHSALFILTFSGIAQFFGPWVARWSVEAHDQTGYAIQQLSLVFAFILLFECVVYPRLLYGLTPGLQDSIQWHDCEELMVSPTGSVASDSPNRRSRSPSKSRPHMSPSSNLSTPMLSPRDPDTPRLAFIQ